MEQTCAGLAHTATVSVSSWELLSCWFRKPCLLGTLHPFCLLHSLYVFSNRCLIREGRKLMEMGLCVLTSLSLCIMSGCDFVNVFPPASGESLLNDIWARHWFEYSRISFYFVFILNSSIWFYLRSLGYLVSLSLTQGQVLVSSSEVSLQSNHISVNYSIFAFCHHGISVSCREETIANQSVCG